MPDFTPGLFVLVDADGAVRDVRRHFDVDPATLRHGEEGYLNPAKARWARFVDAPEDHPFDARWQVRTRTRPPNVPSGNVEVAYEVAARPLADVKAERLAALAAHRYAIETGGIDIGGASIRTDLESQSKIAGAHALVTAEPSTVIDWKGAAGWVQLDAATMTAIALAVGTHIQACYSAERTHAEAIEACETAAAAGTYDFTDGWPT